MTKDLRLQDKRIVITGAASGIGYAAAGLMAAEGARVLIADLDEDAAAAAAAEIGNGAVGLAVDVLDEASLMAMIDRAVAQNKQANAIYQTWGIFCVL